MHESKRLKLVAAGEEQLKELFSFYNDYDLIAGISYTGAAIRPWTWEEFKKDNEDGAGKYAVVLKETGAVIGMAVISSEAFTRIMYPMTYISKEHRGKGLGTELSALITDLAFNEWNAHKIRTTIYDFNEASYRRYESLGWKLEGTLRQEVYRTGRYWDVRYYGLLRTEWEARKGAVV